MGLLAIHIFFLIKCLPNLLLIYKLGYLNSYDGVLSVFFLKYILDIRHITCRCILLVCDFLLMVLFEEKSFKFYEVCPIYSFSYLLIMVLEQKGFLRNLTQYHEDLLLFSSRSFVFLAHISRSVIHFEFIFLNVIMWRSEVFIFIWIFSYFSTIFWKDFLFPIELLGTLLKTDWP